MDVIQKLQRKLDLIEMYSVTKKTGVTGLEDFSSKLLNVESKYNLNQLNALIDRVDSVIEGLPQYITSVPKFTGDDYLMNEEFYNSEGYDLYPQELFSDSSEVRDSYVQEREKNSLLKLKEGLEKFVAHREKNSLVRPINKGSKLNYLAYQRSGKYKPYELKKLHELLLQEQLIDPSTDVNHFLEYWNDKKEVKLNWLGYQYEFKYLINRLIDIEFISPAKNKWKIAEARTLFDGLPSKPNAFNSNIENQSTSRVRRIIAKIRH
ncbi:MAG: hypothetical protein CL840_08910 [Crocinitomicaceae bacterium]|nr:hypothetical protein [Crocinitomicaceae bacterium]|tara:strand:- start:36382 stop:37173 length:792 start_codon:yes stop_codon:yes gene_type:complete